MSGESPWMHVQSLDYWNAWYLVVVGIWEFTMVVIELDLLCYGVVVYYG